MHDAAVKLYKIIHNHELSCELSYIEALNCMLGSDIGSCEVSG